MTIGFGEYIFVVDDEGDNDRGEVGLCDTGAIPVTDAELDRDVLVEDADGDMTGLEVGEVVSLSILCDLDIDVVDAKPFKFEFELEDLDFEIELSIESF